MSTNDTEDVSLKVTTPGRGQHPNSRANLITYPKGVSGNEGSGNGYSLTAELKHALNKEKRKEIVDATIKGAIALERTPFKELWDRVEGKQQDTEPPAQIPTTINIIVVDGETKGLIQQVKERTGKFIEGEVIDATE